MREMNVRLSILAGIFALCAAGIMVSDRAARDGRGTNIFLMPLEAGRWRGAELAVDRQVKELLETPSVMMREYRSGDEAVCLTIVSYRDSRVSFHLPESCLSGEGSVIVSRNKRLVDIGGNGSFAATEFVIEGDKGDQLILYYFETGGVRTNSYAAFRWEMMKRSFAGNGRSGALVRVSSYTRGDPARARDSVLSFLREMGARMSDYME